MWQTLFGTDSVRNLLILNNLVRPRGFEPLTFCSGGKRSIQAELRAHWRALVTFGSVVCHRDARSSRVQTRGITAAGGEQLFNMLTNRFFLHQLVPVLIF